MPGKIKRFFARFIPVSTLSFHKKMKGLSEKQDKQYKQMDKVAKSLSKMQKTINTLEISMGEMQKTMAAMQKNTGAVQKTADSIRHTTTEMKQYNDRMWSALGGIQVSVVEVKRTADGVKGVADATHKTVGEIAAKTKANGDTLTKISGDTQKAAEEITGIAYETLWASIFKDTTHQSPWLTDKTFSPGRWAAGYPFLYILYRILRDVQPKRMIELGLGETTRVISQYAAIHPDAAHYVVEHDPQWIAFFETVYPIPQNTEIVQLPWGFTHYKDSSQPVRVYDGFAERFSNGKYDLICIDGPFGGDMLEYARIDALALIANHLADSFVILVDDYNRKGERNTAAEIVDALEQQGIPYAQSVYRGIKKTFIICSEDQKFLASL